MRSAGSLHKTSLLVIVDEHNTMCTLVVVGSEPTYYRPMIFATKIQQYLVDTLDRGSSSLTSWRVDC